ncbi:hypothetical protein ACVWZA_000121 [Sphingomonas sp. UYAg733]
MNGVPTSRYRVIEKDRRLFVIDTWADGGRPEHSPVSPPSRTVPLLPAAPPKLGLPKLALPKQTRFDGSAEVTTHPFYDDRAPRTIKFDAASMQTLGRVKIGMVVASFAFVLVVIDNPWFLAAPFVLLNPAIRKGVRKAVTAWLDRIEHEAAQP